ncbi:hypothetical protein B6U96_04825, partial [Archaeoglobales archaeon ex4484_92]
MVRLKKISPYANGLLILLIYAEIVNFTGLTVPVLDGSLVKKLIYVPVKEIEFLYPILSFISALQLGFIAIILSLSTILALTDYKIAAIAVSTVLAIASFWKKPRKTLASILVAIIFLEIFTIAHYFMRAAKKEVFLFEYAVYWDYAIRLMLGFLTPLLVVLFLTAGYLALIKSLQKKSEKIDNKKPNWLYLFTGIALSISLGYLIYSPLFNPKGKLIGVDSINYINFIKTMKKDGVLKLMTERLERSLFLLLLYTLTLLFGEYAAVKILPSLVLTFYTITIYLATYELLGGRHAELTALIAPLNYTVTAGIFSAYYNNLTATSLILLSTYFIQKWIKKQEKKNLAISAFLLELSVYTHSFMTMFYSIVLALTSIRLKKKKWILLALALITAIQSTISIHYWITRESGEALVSAGASFSGNWWDGVKFVVYNCAASIAVNPIEWILA